MTDGWTREGWDGLFGNKKRADWPTCEATVLSIRLQGGGPGNSRPDRMTVRYEVDGVTYEHTEGLMNDHETIKLGPIPIGQRLWHRVDVPVGGTVQVRYDPNRPSRAQIVGNEGTWAFA